MQTKKEENKKISVIIPVYKAEKYIDRCLESVTNQTYKNLEIILVDDGSPDNSPAICDKWAKQDNRIKVIHKQNSGVSAARNSAIKISTGDYIIFIDADDTIELETYEKLINQLSEGIDTVVHKAKNIYTNGSIKYKYEKNLILLEENKNNIIPFYYKEDANNPNNLNVMGSCWRFLFNANVIKSNNILFNENLIYQEDKEFILRYLLRCKKIKVVDEYLYNYYNLPSSASHGKQINKKLVKNLRTLFDWENETFIKNPYLTKKQIKTLKQRSAIAYTTESFYRYFNANASKHEIKDLYKDEDFKYLLKNVNPFFYSSKFMRFRKFIAYYLIKFKLAGFLGNMYKKIKKIK